MENAPAISVIMPMYNSEKYVAECLDSLLAQTLQDFEVILVNDCSTDSSRAIAESYVPKFDGRLKLLDNEKNSGPGASRNNGLQHATGEYIYFMDSDDLILPDGLEKLYTTAKQFDVDVVHATGSYNMSEDGKERTIMYIKKPSLPKGPILEQNPEWRMKNLLANGGAPWRKFSRREFLIENELFFPENVRTAEDTVWTHGLWCLAKKIIHTPLTVYLYRKSANSLTRTKIAPLQNINTRICNLITVLKWIENIMSKSSFFEEKPQYRYAMLSHLARLFFLRMFKSSLEVSPTDMFMSIRQELGKNFGKYDDVVVPVLCTMINQYQKEIDRYKTRIAEFEEQLKAK